MSDDFDSGIVAARAALDQTLPMLDGMFSLLAEVQAAGQKAGLSETLTALVAERFMDMTGFMVPTRPET